MPRPPFRGALEPRIYTLTPTYTDSAASRALIHTAMAALVLGAVSVVYMKTWRAVAWVKPVTIIVGTGIVAAWIVIVTKRRRSPVPVVRSPAVPAVVVTPVALVAVVVASNVLGPSPISSIVRKSAFCAH